MSSKIEMHLIRSYLIILFIVLIGVISINCSSGSWLDDGDKYLCPECREAYGSELMPCQHCGINPTPFNYCYDCAKELNRCQLCGQFKAAD